MDRPIDHLVLAGRDLDALGASYRRLGFLVGGRNRHSWGTENRIVQLQGGFLELIGLAQDFQTLGADDPAAPFANTIEQHLGRREGLALVALRSSDAEGDARRFAASGIGLSAPLRFSRTAESPDGTRREVAFTIAFALDPEQPVPEFFVCQHHHPENFWNPAMQQHPNGARCLLGLVLTAEKPGTRMSFMTKIFGQGCVTLNEGSLSMVAANDRIDWVTPRHFEAVFGEQIGERPAAARIGVEDIDAVRRFLNVMGSPYAVRDTRIVVPPSVGGGVTLSFEPLH